nr:MerR family transcriptional regulator [Deinococcus budaensis]
MLPVDRASRPKDEVNPRLVRHYTTQGLLPAPRREGRDARYGRLHLVALLALRRLMADGLGGKALTAAVAGQDEATLERLALEGAVDQQDAPDADDNDALRYLRNLSARQPLRGRGRAASAPPPAALPEVLFESPRRVSQTTRVTVRPGLEMYIASEFEWPQTASEWRALLRELGTTLRDVHQPRE